MAQFASPFGITPFSFTFSAMSALQVKFKDLIPFPVLPLN
jgi:hypothetical protein